MQKKNQVATSKWVDLLVFVLFVNVFFFHSFGTVALWMLLLGLWILLIRVFEVKLSEPSWVRWGGSGVIALALLTYVNVNSPEKVVLLVLTTLSTMVVCTYIWLKRGKIGGILELVLAGLLVARAYARSCLQILRAVIVGNMRHILALDQVKKQSSPWTRSLMVGGLVGLPLVAWLILTLAKADPVFATFVKGLLSENFLKELPWRLFFSVLAFLALVPLLLMHLKEYVSPLGWLTRARWGREMAVVTGMVALVLGIFLVVQWPYVFANVAKETELIKYGVATYSEYVTKGFWDLLKVVVMVFGVAWVGLILNKNQKGTEKQILLGVQGVLGLEFAVFIVSIFRRVWLYQSYHGLSLARLYGLALLIAVVGMMVTMALRYLYSNVRWVKVEMAWILVVVFGSIWINMESLVVQNPPTVNGRVDYVYLSRLPSDGKEGWKQAFDWAQELLQRLTQAENPNGHMYVFNREERRDMFYAGIVGRQLALKYYDLVVQYGTDDELRDFYRQVVKTELAELQSPGLEGIARSDKDFAARRSQAIETLKKYEQVVEQPDWSDKMRVTPVYGRGYDWRMIKGSENLRRPYFMIDDSKERGRLTGWDYVLAFDPSMKGVYQWMRQQIGIEKILRIESMDLALQQRIVWGPVADQDFDVDISLDSPFLR